MGNAKIESYHENEYQLFILAKSTQAFKTYHSQT